MNCDNNKNGLQIDKLQEAKYDIEEIIDLFYNHNEEANVDKGLIYIPIANREGKVYKSRKISLVDMLRLYNYSEINAIDIYNILAKNNYIYDTFYQGEKLEVKDNKMFIPAPDLSKIEKEIEELWKRLPKETLEFEFCLQSDPITKNYEMVINGVVDESYQPYIENRILYTPILLKINKQLLTNDKLPNIEVYEYECNDDNDLSFNGSFYKIFVNTEVYFKGDFLYVNLYFENLSNILGKIIIN